MSFFNEVRTIYNELKSFIKNPLTIFCIVFPTLSAIDSYFNHPIGFIFVLTISIVISVIFLIYALASSWANNLLKKFALLIWSVSYIFRTLLSIGLIIFFAGLIIKSELSMIELILLISILYVINIIIKNGSNILERIATPNRLLISFIIVTSYNYFFNKFSFISNTYNTFSNYLNYLFEYITFFNISNFSVYIRGIYDKSSFEFVVAIIVVILTYCYITLYLKNKGHLLFNANSDEDVKFLPAIIQIYIVINELLFYILLFYLLNDYNNILQISFLMIFYIISNIIMRIPGISLNIISNYQTLNQLNIFSTYNAIMTTQNVNNRINFLNNLLDNLVMATISLYTTKKENTPTLNQIFIISILFAIAGYLFGFNILTIFYIEILLLVYYAIISMIKGIPIKKSDVYLNNGYVCKDVYITDNTSSEFITVLNKRNVTIKIMKSSIMQIVDEHKRIGNQNITEQIPNMLNNMLNR